MSQFSNTERGREIQSFVLPSRNISLDAIAVEEVIFVQAGEWAVRNFYAIYTEAANVAAGIGRTVLLGTPTSPAKFSNWRAKTSAAKHNVTNIPLQGDIRSLASDEPLILKTSPTFGNKGGGKAVFFVRVSLLRS